MKYTVLISEILFLKVSFKHVERCVDSIVKINVKVQLTRQIGISVVS